MATDMLHVHVYGNRISSANAIRGIHDRYASQNGALSSGCKVGRQDLKDAYSMETTRL